MIESLTVIVTALITAVVGPSIVEYLKNKLNKKKPVDPLKNALHVSDQITTKLEDLQDTCKADRVWILQFHNGGHFYPTGKSIQKFSMFYEILNPGVSSVQNNFQNIPVNLFSKLINGVYENETICITDYKDVTVATYGFKYVADEIGAKSDYIFALKSLEGKFVGILGISYTKRKHTLSTEDVHEIETHAAAIGSVLCTDLGC